MVEFSNKSTCIYCGCDMIMSYEKFTKKCCNSCGMERQRNGQDIAS